jgi:peptidase C39-like protein
VTVSLRAVALLCAAAWFLSPVLAQTPPAPPALLAVPYLPQTEALCGGAAAAMVMRYWGARDIYPDAFASLVDRSAGGIRTSALVGALEARHWTAVAGPGDTAQLTLELGRGRPVIALIEDRPGRFHYVVVVAAAADNVVLHDPARAPSRVLPAGKFDAAWQKSQRWMLILLPPPPAPPGPDLDVRDGTRVVAPRTSRSDPGACAASVSEGVALAEKGDKAAARRVLEEATRSCPPAAGPWRELAGLDTLDENWTAAAAHARRAVALDPQDDHAWRVLATAEYLRHDDFAALDAWNRLGEPRTDLVDIKGLAHTRYMVIADAIGLRPGQVVTPSALRLGRRRVLAVPAISAARLSFEPREDGRAQIDVSVVERDPAPASYASWIGIGLRAATNRELGTSFSNVSGGGDVITVSWRWWEHRPMVAASYAAPGPFGVWRLDASRETQTFGASAFEETRTRAGAEIGNWIGQRAQVRGGAGVESWSDRPRTAALSARLELWPVVDRLALDGGVSTWRGAGAPFSAADVAVRVRSTAVTTGTVWRGDVGYRAVTASSPASVWPATDSGSARDVLLRAHPLLDDGVIRGGVIGRRLAFSTIEIQHWLDAGTRLVRVAPAAFVDIARASRGMATTTDRTQIDAGVGLRLSLPGTGVLRVDLAHGLRDRRNAFSVAWQR